MRSATFQWGWSHILDGEELGKAQSVSNELLRGGKHHVMKGCRTRDVGVWDVDERGIRYRVSPLLRL